MNTHLNMTMTRTNGNVGNGTNLGVINNAALQLLLGSKDAAAVVSFEAETGWSWRDACTTALEADSANLLATKSAAEIALMKTAADITTAAFRAAGAQVQKGMTPDDINALIIAGVLLMQFGHAHGALEVHP